MRVCNLSPSATCLLAKSNPLPIFFAQSFLIALGRSYEKKNSKARNRMRFVTPSGSALNHDYGYWLDYVNLLAAVLWSVFLTHWRNYHATQPRKENLFQWTFFKVIKSTSLWEAKSWMQCFVGKAEGIINESSNKNQILIFRLLVSPLNWHWNGKKFNCKLENNLNFIGKPMEPAASRIQTPFDTEPVIQASNAEFKAIREFLILSHAYWKAYCSPSYSSLHYSRRALDVLFQLMLLPQ